MKTKLLFICALLFAMGQSFGQIHVFENFDYSPIGNSLLTPAVNTNSGTSTIWNNYTAGSPTDMTIEAGPVTGWTLPQAFDLNPMGNAVHWQGGGEDGELDFTPVSGEGEVIYLSFLLDVVGWQTTTQGHAPQTYRHVSLGINDSGNVGSSLFIGPTETPGDMKFRLALGNSDKSASGDIVWFPTEYPYTDIGTAATATDNQFFIVIKYVIGDGVTDGTGTGDGYMWVNPSAFGTEPAFDVHHNVAGAQRNRTNFQTVLLQASSNNRNPDNYVDEIRVAGSWEEATNQPPLSVSENELAKSIKLYPNPAQDVINIESKSIRLSSVDMYNVIGAKVLSSELTNDRINVSSLVRGVYFMKINAQEGGSITKRVVIK